MSRNAVAAELQRLIEDLQRLCAQAERLAASSGMVSPSHFRGAQTMLTMAAGDLDQKGLLHPHPAPVQEAG
jgi:hypothetical protein